MFFKFLDALIVFRVLENLLEEVNSRKFYQSTGLESYGFSLMSQGYLMTLDDVTHLCARFS